MPEPKTCPDCGKPSAPAHDSHEDMDDFVATHPYDTVCWVSRDDHYLSGLRSCRGLAIARLRSRVAELEIRRREGRGLLQRMVKRVRENEMIVPESRLGKVAAQVADYLNRTHEPSDILRTVGADPRPYYLIERTIQGVAHWAAWDNRAALEWVTDAATADRFDWSVHAERVARAYRANGHDVSVTEHLDLPRDTEDDPNA